MFKQLALAVPGSLPASGGQDYSSMKDMKSMKSQKTKIFKPFMLFMVPFVRSLLCANVFDL
jgi:hypothetical protein